MDHLDEPRRLRAPSDLVAYRGLLGEEELAVLEWSAEPAPEPPTLTAAEARVLDLARSGLHNAEIAVRRGTSERTIATQLAAIFRKLRVGSRAELFALSSVDPPRGDR